MRLLNQAAGLSRSWVLEQGMRHTQRMRWANSKVGSGDSHFIVLVGSE